MHEGFREHAPAILLSTLIMGMSVALTTPEGIRELRIREGRLERKKYGLGGAAWLPYPEFSVNELIESANALPDFALQGMASNNQVGLFLSDPALMAFLSMTTGNQDETDQTH